MRVELVAQVGEVVELGERGCATSGACSSLEQQPHARHGGERLAQRDEIARAGGAERGARDQPLDVVDRLQRVAQLGALGAAERELLDGVEAVLDALERQQRPQQPGAQQPAAHRRDRAIDLVRAATRRGRRRADFDHLEVPQRGRIDDQAVGAGAEGDLADVREIGLLRVAQVLDERAGGADRGGDGLRARSRARLCVCSWSSSARRADFELERPRLDAW